MSDQPINCGRCANLWGPASGKSGFGICASHARQVATNQIRPAVDLTSTCEHAILSAKFDPDFMPRVLAARRGTWDPPAPVATIETAIQPEEPKPTSTSDEKFQDTDF